MESLNTSSPGKGTGGCWKHISAQAAELRLDARQTLHTVRGQGSGPQQAPANPPRASLDRTKSAHQQNASHTREQATTPATTCPTPPSSHPEHTSTARMASPTEPGRLPLALLRVLLGPEDGPSSARTLGCPWRWPGLGTSPSNTAFKGHATTDLTRMTTSLKSWRLAPQGTAMGMGEHGGTPRASAAATWQEASTEASQGGVRRGRAVIGQVVTKQDRHGKNLYRQRDQQERCRRDSSAKSACE